MGKTVVITRLVFSVRAVLRCWLLDMMREIGSLFSRCVLGRRRPLSLYGEEEEAGYGFLPLATSSLSHTRATSRRESCSMASMDREDTIIARPTQLSICLSTLVSAGLALLVKSSNGARE